MSNLYNLARSGLNAAQAGINTTGHNVANANTPGFSRQQVLISSAGAQGGAGGYSGMGVQVQTVRRIYDSFLTGQLNTSTAASSALSTYSAQIDRINNLLADRTVGVSPAISKFYDGVSAVASNPADPAARQELIGRANSLVSQLQTANQFLSDQQQSINQQIDTTVQQINSFAQRISNLNAAIVDARASVSGQVPNDLLDQRDQLVTGLNELVSVTVIQNGDSINLSVGNGQTLLSDTTVFPLDAVQSAIDPGRTALAYTAADGTVVELSDQSISGGSLGGLLRFRRETLDTAQNELGRIAVGMAITFNQQHVQGMDAAGNKALTIQPSTPQNTAASITGKVSDVSAFEKAAASYEVKFNGTDFTVTAQGNPASPVAAQYTPAVPADGKPATLSFDGITLDVTGYMPTGAGAGETFTLDTRQMSFYSLATPVPIANANNTGSAKLSMAYTDVGKLSTSDYQLSVKGNAFTLTRQPEGTSIQLKPEQIVQAGGVTSLSFDGIRVDVSGTAKDGDSWMIQPTRNSARDIGVVVTDASAIAAADLAGGSANGRNALELAALQSKGTLASGSMSITGAYSQLVNGIGVKTQAIQTASTAQDSLTAQSFAAQQAVSGVNLNEEYINLDYYMQHYNASARLIDVASNLFDTLLGLRA